MMAPTDIEKMVIRHDEQLRANEKDHADSWQAINALREHWAEIRSEIAGMGGKLTVVFAVVVAVITAAFKYLLP